MQSRSTFLHDPSLSVHLMLYRSKLCERKIRFLKEGYKTAAKAMVSSVKSRWSWKCTDERLEHSFGNVGPIKYKIGDCVKKKKIDVPRTAWCMWCEHKISFANKGKYLMRYFVTDKHLEGLKVRVTNYQIGVVGPLNQHQKAEKQQII